MLQVHKTVEKYGINFRASRTLRVTSKLNFAQKSENARNLVPIKYHENKGVIIALCFLISSQVYFKHEHGQGESKHVYRKAKKAIIYLLRETLQDNIFTLFRRCCRPYKNAFECLFEIFRKTTFQIVT